MCLPLIVAILCSMLHVCLYSVFVVSRSCFLFVCACMLLVVVILCVCLCWLQVCVSYSMFVDCMCVLRSCLWSA